MKSARTRRLPVAVLRKHLIYDAATGFVYWLTKPNKRLAAGVRAGSANSKAYRYIGILGRRYLEHVVIWALATGKWPTETIDHRDRDTFNNRLENLREATRSQQLSNMPPHTKNTSGVRGVYYSKHMRCWVAQFSHTERTISIGHFETKEDAAAARRAYEQKHWGEFAQQEEAVSR